MRRSILMLLSVAACAFAQEGSEPPPEPLTADVLLDRANAAFTAGKFAEAEAFYSQFTGDFGRSAEAREALVRIRFPRAICLVQLAKFSDALALIEEILGSTPPPPVDQARELLFWKGVCEMQSERFDAARLSLSDFATRFPGDPRASEARLLHAMSFLVEGRPKDAIAPLQSAANSLPGAQGGRAAVMALVAATQADELGAALDWVDHCARSEGRILQWITWQRLLLDLGSRLLEREDFSGAVRCLRRVGSAAESIRRQEVILTDLRHQRERADGYAKFMLGQLASSATTELEAFRKIPNFDSALRARLASAFQSMQRPREAALLIEAMLRGMPPDKLVEQASVQLAQLWSELERWPKVRETVATFTAKFPKSELLPTMFYIGAIGEQKAGNHAEAIARFDDISRWFPKSDFAVRSLFMKGFTLLLAERNPDAVAVFENFANAHAAHDLAEASGYWRGMAYSFDKQYDRCRDAMDELMKRFPDGSYRASALFRKAYAAHAKRDFATSITENRSLLKAFPDHEERSEALILLGDALMNEGEMEEGLKAYAAIPPEPVRFFEEGVFKSAKALQLLEREDDLLALLTRFCTDHPHSSRIPEAIRLVGKVYQSRNQPDLARDAYWKAIETHGNAPRMTSVEDLFPALARLYAGAEESDAYASRLETLADRAASENGRVLLLRVRRAQADFVRKSDPQRRIRILADASALCDPASTSPAILAELAEALEMDGNATESERLYRELIRWNPRSAEKDRAFASLARAALRMSQPEVALAWMTRFQSECPSSMLSGKVLLEKARIEETRNQMHHARATLEALLAHPASGGAEKAQALFRLGELHMIDGAPAKAFPYFQRIYVMHGRWREWVARAYLRSADALGALSDQEGVRRTYEEMLGREELSELPEFSEARSRLHRLQEGVG